MRLWSEQIIQKLDRQRLLGQWRECIALLGKGWGRKHSVVDYVFKYDRGKLAEYSRRVAEEMIRRGYRPNLSLITCHATGGVYPTPVYSEHDSKYLAECLSNLRGKGIIIEGVS